MQNRTFRVPLILALLTVAGSLAQAVAPDSVTLSNSIKEVASQPTTHGPAVPYIVSRTLTSEQNAAPLKFEVALKMRNFSELQERVAKGERISTTEMAEKYEPLASEYQAVVDWAESEGLTITKKDSHHMVLFLTGKVGHVGQSLGVSFARVSAEGKEYTSAITAPHIPAGLSAVLLGINGLQPHLVRHKNSIRRKAASGGGSIYKPAQIASAYKATSLYTSNIVGTGQTIAIVIDTFPATSDLQNFWTKTGINQSLENIQFIQVVNGSLPDPTGEETLDVEWASAMAPGANVRVYAATDLSDQHLDASYQAVLDDVTNHPEYNIHQLSMSYGEGETSIADSQLDTDAQFFAELAAQGVTCFASSGDNGSTPNDNFNGGQNGPLQVENPASDPSVTGVGGTTLILDSTNNVTSETVWNNNSGDTGGGVSIHFNRPSWQTGTGVSTSSKRQVPDIAGTSDPVYGGYVFFQGQPDVFAGTSLACPIIAGFNALINQARATNGLGPIGILGPSLYPLIGTAKLRDITSGNNATASSGGKYAATVGYDKCTGVGAPLMLALTQSLAQTTTLIGLQNPPPSKTVFPGQNTTFTAGVGGGSPTYQWQREPIGSSTWSNLGNTSTYSGVTTATLTIANTTLGMSGDQFRCVIGVNSTSLTSSSSVLIVDRPLVVSLLAGRVATTGFTNGTGTSAKFNYPSGMALDSSGNIYVADYGNNQIRKITPAGLVTTPFGSASAAAGSTNGNGNAALFRSPNAVAADSANNLYVADSGNNLVRKITGTTVSTLAGSGNVFSGPQGIAVDSSGNVYVADTGNNMIRKITPGGTVSILAGSNTVGGYADGNATTQALFNAPEAVAVDSSGNVYVADMSNSVIRKISGGTVTTVAGTVGAAGFADGLRAKARFNAPTGLAFDASGNLYITDSLVPSSTSNVAGNCVVRKLTQAGVVSTVAGSPGVTGSANGTGTDAQFFSVQAVACDPSGLVYLADTYNQTIRVSSVSGVATLAHASVTLTNLNTTYTGSAQPAGATTNPNGLSVTITYNGSSTPPTEVGSYAVVGTINDSNYSGSASGTLVINKAIVTVTLGGLSGTYDGSPHAVTVTTTPNNLPVTLTYNNSTSAPSAVGTYIVRATVSNANYAGAATGTLVISKGAATIMFGGLSFNYDGSGKTATATTSPAGLPVTFTYNNSTKLPVAVGSYAVVATVNTANAAGTANGTLTISPGTATVTLGNLARTYTGKTQVATATTSPAKLAVTFTYAGSPIPPTMVGSYAVVATVNNSNYTGTDTGTLVIAPVLPLATTGAALAGPTSATLNALIGPKGAATSVVFQYGTTTTYDHTTASQTVPADTATVPVAKAISGLSSQTLYHYRVVATNSAGSVNGLDKTFTTLALPIFTGNGTAYLSATGAQLSQMVNPNGVATQVYFEYGTTSGNYTAQSAVQTIGAGKANVTVYALLSGLTANTTYFYRLVTVTAGGGTIASPTESTFTTLGFDTALVAQKGDAATEVANAIYNAFGNPIINSHDAIAFAATLTGSGATTTTNLAIFAETNLGVPHKIVRTGDTAPGAGGATFASVGDPVFNNNAAVAFGGQLKIVTGQATKATALGVWSTSSGSLQLVARQGSVAPDTSGALFSTFNAVGLSDADTVILGTLTTNAALGVTAATNFGVWEGTTSNDLALVLRTGDVVGNKTISSLSLFSTQAIVGGQTRNFASNSGNLVCGATFSDKTTGIVKVIGGNESLVAAKTDVAVGTNGATFATFGNPIINTNNHVAFAATLTPAVGLVTTTNNAGIWAENGSSTRQLIARTGDVAPGTNPAAAFVSFTDPVYNNNQAVAFGGTLKVAAGQATKTTALGIWCNSGGTLENIIQQGDPAPGCPIGATFAAFPAIALPDTGGVIFKATLNANTTANVTTASNTGLWAIDNNGDLQLIVRTGGNLGGKTITALTILPSSNATDSQSRSFTQTTGDVVYLATFSDGSSAIYNVQFP